uniref:LRAT domain-containing protein n=1 Tax=Mastacembelus armatus TaxID=205130 RepID=A0A3Q3SNN8_9TELE
VGKMRNVVLVAVILQLSFDLCAVCSKCTVSSDFFLSQKYEFGDIISFKRHCICKNLTYKHFAVYVGGKDIEGKQKDQDLFQRTGIKLEHQPLKLSDCVFDKLENEHESSKHEEKDNYLDEPGFRCGTYNPLVNNCEHVATYVRYGVRLSLQVCGLRKLFSLQTPAAAT